jgi:hypothetical protein
MTKLTVKTDVGTFTRKTARTYTHIVVVKDVRHECLEAERQRELTTYRETVREYRETVATGASKRDPTPWHREQTATFLADGSYAKWIADYDAMIADLDARGVIADDRRTPWEVTGWCGRLDLARKLYASSDLQRRRHVRIYDVATGQQVRG